MVPIPIAAVLEPAPPPFLLSELPACTAADLSLTFDGGHGDLDGLRRDGTLMVVRNVGARPCRVGALPSVAFAGPDGAVLPIRFRPPPGLHPGPVVPDVGLAPGAEVTAELRWGTRAEYPNGRCLRPAAVRVAFGTVALAAPFAARMCGPAADPVPFGQAWLRPDARLGR